MDAWTVRRGLSTTAASLRLAFLRHVLPGPGRAQAREDLREMSSNAATSRPRNARLRSTLVTEGLVTGDPALRPHLDASSGELLKLDPDRPTLRGSRGAVLVPLHRWGNGPGPNHR